MGAVNIAAKGLAASKYGTVMAVVIIGLFVMYGYDRVGDIRADNADAGRIRQAISRVEAGTASAEKRYGKLAPVPAISDELIAVIKTVNTVAARTGVQYNVTVDHRKQPAKEFPGMLQAEVAVNIRGTYGQGLQVAWLIFSELKDRPVSWGDYVYSGVDGYTSFSLRVVGK